MRDSTSELYLDGRAEWSERWIRVVRVLQTKLIDEHGKTWSLEQEEAIAEDNFGMDLEQE